MAEFNLALVPTDKMYGKLIELSQLATSDFQTVYELGRTSEPHMTVAQFEADEKDLAVIWEQLKKIPVCDVPLRVGQFYISPEKEKLGCYTGLHIQKTSELQNFHNAVVENLGERVCMRFFGVTYFPHFTLNLLRREDADTMNIAPCLAPLEFTEYKPVIGRSGHAGILEEILYS